ncbi:MAG: NAD-binding protein [Deltaproteobacteria bacterium]|nr:NAD-binding protein [Deltaproteobacteria bacterium]
MKLPRGVRANWLYARALAREFRYTLLTFAVLVVVGAVLFRVTPLADYPKPNVPSALYGTFSLLGLGQPFNFPSAWYLRILYLTYPLIGIGVVVQAVVRFGFLLVSKKNNEKEWTRVLASTFRDHIILCGLGNVGFRVLERLRQYHLDVVAIEKDGGGQFVAAVKAQGVPVIIADVKEDESLVQAGIARARAIVIATNDDLANIEVALDARRMSPEIHVILRMFDQDIARKIGQAFGFERTFSASSLAAPAVAALALEGNVLGSCDVGDRTYITAEVVVQPGSRLSGKAVGSFHHDFGAWIIALRRGGGELQHVPASNVNVAAGDGLVVQAVLEDLHRLNDAAGRAPAPSPLGAGI